MVRSSFWAKQCRLMRLAALRQRRQRRKRNRRAENVPVAAAQVVDAIDDAQVVDAIDDAQMVDAAALPSPPPPPLDGGDGGGFEVDDEEDGVVGSEADEAPLPLSLPLPAAAAAAAVAALPLPLPLQPQMPSCYFPPELLEILFAHLPYYTAAMFSGANKHARRLWLQLRKRIFDFRSLAGGMARRRACESELQARVCRRLRREARVMLEEERTYQPFGPPPPDVRMSQRRRLFSDTILPHSSVEEDDPEVDWDSFVHLVDTTLDLQPAAHPITTFIAILPPNHPRCCFRRREAVDDCVDRWVKRLSEHLQQFWWDTSAAEARTYNFTKIHVLPIRIFTLQQLTTLHLSHCSLPYPITPLSLPSIQHLQLCHVYDPKSFPDLLSGCCQTLQSLALLDLFRYHFDIIGHMHLPHFPLLSSLRVTLLRNWCFRVETSMPSLARLEIHAMDLPNLGMVDPKLLPRSSPPQPILLGPQLQTVKLLVTGCEYLPRVLHFLLGISTRLTELEVEFDFSGDVVWSLYDVPDRMVEERFTVLDTVTIRSMFIRNSGARFMGDGADRQLVGYLLRRSPRLMRLNVVVQRRGGRSNSVLDELEGEFRAVEWSSGEASLHVVWSD